ncbi:TetR/AcrR family transcriptional regulator [Amycolatopsis cihanbeyliensis]|uniref:TetR family transcriptional regulator n=1 Tax=Amycolatopsis cihanbeyliensis TaxID=1128664 RepID=A0A542DCL1_AMYCI|nr:TetR/AcrR family transcriptional regulator [Amycolatopsis cihanbeyliensis]TQJ00812.1 TetR family transcriptional regulator [Amycolatopsis cihanbeyliensis]
MQIMHHSGPEFGDGAGYSVTEAARRTQIIGATIETLAELGYHRTSFARIVERAGLSSTRMISYYFPSKNELMFAVVGDILDSQDLTERYTPDTDRAGLLRAYIEAEIDFLRTHPLRVRALLEIGRNWTNEGGTNDGGTEPHRAALNGMLWRDIQLGQIERQLTQGQREGAFGEFDASVMAMTIRQALDGAAIKLAAQPDLDLAAYGAELADLFDRATRA